MKAINRDILREIWKTKSKFISIVIIMFLGVFVFVGLKETPPTMENTVNKYFKEVNMYDLKITNNFSLTEEDIEIVKKYDKISSFETYYVKSVVMAKVDANVNIYSLPEKIAKAKIISGRLPEKETEIVLTESLKNKYSINEEITISYENEKNKLDKTELKNKTYRVVGFVYGADMPESSSNNSANTNFFAYVLKENFNTEKYAGINIILKNIDRENFTVTSYYDSVNKYRDDLLNIFKVEQEKHNTKFRADNEKTIAENNTKLNTAKEELLSAKNLLEQIKDLMPEEYEKQLAELSKKEEELKEQEDLFAVTSKQLAATNYPRFIVTNIKGNQTYKQFIEAVASLDSIANIFSVFLFAVAVLVALTTLTRMIEENRTNIGTLKSIGYDNNNIAKKYYFYGIFSAVGGAILGIIGAYLVIVPVIYNSYAQFLTLRVANILPDIKIILLALLIAILCVLFAVYIPLRKILAEKSAYLLRPKAPKNGSRVFLEHLTFIWARITFLHKVTFRNIFRYKVRMLMTIFGILGCLALMFIGFGIRFSAQNISHEQFNVINKYDTIVQYNPYITSSQKDDLVNTINNNKNIEASKQINIMSASIEKNNEVLDALAIFTVENNLEDYFTLKNNLGPIALSDDGVVINKKLAYLHNLNPGDTIDLIVKEKEYRLKVKDINTNYFGHTLFMTKTYYEKVFGESYEYNSFLIKANHNREEVKNIIDEIEKNKNVTYIQNNLARKDLFNNVVAGIDIIVLVIVFCSTSLALVVLYNLINVNVSERIRELSTIKVLGFYSSEVTIYIFREIFYLAIIGIIIGNCVGSLLYKKIIPDLTARNATFGSEVSIWTYITSSGITLLIIIFVMFIMHRRLKRVNMVEALKSVE